VIKILSINIKNGETIKVILDSGVEYFLTPKEGQPVSEKLDIVEMKLSTKDIERVVKDLKEKGYLIDI
jgi:hypothetical protein